jgi:Fe-S cluster biogenesis protein NfuA
MPNTNSTPETHVLKRTVEFQETPNPQAYKFFWGEKITDTSLDVKSSDEASVSPLATKIFGFPWTQSVYIGNDFVTIEKQDWVSWEVLAEPLANLIEEHLERGEPIVLSTTAQAVEGEQSDLVEKIKWVLHNEIRPAVAVDGGDVEFISYTQGYLKIAMKGACSGCPSSQITLKEGIESHLKDLFPEIVSVDSL